LGYCGVPKRAPKGPPMQKMNSFLFIVATKKFGFPSNSKWKFVINATTIIRNFVALLERLHREIWPQVPKIA